MSEPIKNRYDFVLLFDVKDGNPNGDPDAGNLPRLDPETGEGLVTDVCLKRKVRNFVQLTKASVPGYDIYVKEKAVLGRAHTEAFHRLGIQLGEQSRAPIPPELADGFAELDLPEGLSLEEDDGAFSLVVEADTDKKVVREWLKESKPTKPLKDFLTKTLREAKSRKPSAEETDRGRAEMCAAYYDIRTFGAVMALKSAPNCGQVRGPVQLSFARSIGQVVPLEHSITRMAVATEAEAEKQSGDNRTMGRKFTIPYGLYRCHGFVSAALAQPPHGTGFSEDDLNLFWDAMKRMFWNDNSSARVGMATRRLVVFKHESMYGNAPAHELFSMLTVKPNKKTPRDYTDFDVVLDKKGLPSGVTVEEKV
jgi:CRISPR-associated protein Csd2